MVSVHDVPSSKLIAALAAQMKEVPGVEQPEWSRFVKTGSHAERPPADSEWWFTRAASLMRKLYLHGPVGLGDLERAYGGTKALKYYPKHHRDAGGSSIRKILKQLEQAELVTKQGSNGRILTPKGVALLDKLSKEIFKELSKEKPALTRYT